MIPSPIINITADYIIPGTLFGTPPRLLFFSAFLPAVLHSKKAGQLGPDLPIRDGKVQDVSRIRTESAAQITVCFRGQGNLPRFFPHKQ
jgi:hypothetical protein